MLMKQCFCLCVFLIVPLLNIFCTVIFSPLATFVSSFVIITYVKCLYSYCIYMHVIDVICTVPAFSVTLLHFVYCCLLLHCLSPLFKFAITHSFEVIYFSTIAICFAICQALFWLMYYSTAYATLCVPFVAFLSILTCFALVLFYFAYNVKIFIVL